MFVLRNADLRFTNVKAFLSEEDIGRGVFMASVPNDVPIEYIGNGVMDEEAYVAVRLLDLTCICWEGKKPMIGTQLVQWWQDMATSYWQRRSM